MRSIVLLLLLATPLAGATTTHYDSCANTNIFGGTLTIDGDIISVGETATTLQVGDPTGDFMIGSVPFVDGTFMQACVLEEQQPAFTGGSGGPAGSATTRVLNTIFTYGDIDCSLSSNEVTLGAGTYMVSVSASIKSAGKTYIFLENTTGNVLLVKGQNAQVVSDTSAVIVARLHDILTLSTQTTFTLEHYCQTGCTFGTTHTTNVPNTYARLSLFRLF